VTTIKKLSITAITHKRLMKKDSISLTSKQNDSMIIQEYNYGRSAD